MEQLASATQGTQIITRTWDNQNTHQWESSQWKQGSAISKRLFCRTETLFTNLLVISDASTERPVHSEQQSLLRHSGHGTSTEAESTQTFRIRSESKMQKGNRKISSSGILYDFILNISKGAPSGVPPSAAHHPLLRNLLRCVRPYAFDRYAHDKGRHSGLVR